MCEERRHSQRPPDRRNAASFILSEKAIFTPCDLDRPPLIGRMGNLKSRSGAGRANSPNTERVVDQRVKPVCSDITRNKMLPRSRVSIQPLTGPTLSLWSGAAGQPSRRYLHRSDPPFLSAMRCSSARRSISSRASEIFSLRRHSRSPVVFLTFTYTSPGSKPARRN